jgi:hypothetical protein
LGGFGSFGAVEQNEELPPSLYLLKTEPANDWRGCHVWSAGEVLEIAETSRRDEH